MSGFCRDLPACAGRRGFSWQRGDPVSTAINATTGVVFQSSCPSLDLGLFPAAALVTVFTTVQKPAQATKPIPGKQLLLTLASPYWLLWLEFKLVLGKTLTVLF